MDARRNQGLVEGLRSESVHERPPNPPIPSPSSGSVSSTGFDVTLMHQRLPKVVVNIQGRGISVQTPSPVPKNPLRSQQLQEILEPLHLSLLHEDSRPASRNAPQATTETQLRILRSLIQQNPEVLSLPELHLKAQELESGGSESDFPSPRQVLQRAQSNFMKTRTLESDSEILKSHRALRLSKIVESVTKLDASVELKKKTWMFKPRNGGSAKDKLRAQLKVRNKLRNLYQPSESQTSPMDVEECRKLCPKEPNSESSESESKSEETTTIISTVNEADERGGEFALDRREKLSGADASIGKSHENASHVDRESEMLPPAPPKSSQDLEESELVLGGDDSTGKKPGVLTKGQPKHVAKKVPPRSRHRVLVLQRKSKIRPGTLFKCRRTKEKLTFTTVHRTITESGLALLASAYALRSGSIQTEVQEKQQRLRKRTSCKVSSTNLPSGIDPGTSLRELARHSEFGSSGAHGSALPAEINTKGNCYCSNTSKSRTTPCEPKSTPSAFSLRKSSLQHPSMILVNRYTQSLQDSNTETVEFPPPDGIFDHTIELLAYGRELERKIQLFKTEGVLVNIGKRPTMKIYVREQFGEELVPTVPIEKNSVSDALDQGICDFLAHAGFSQANLAVVEVLSDVLRNYYEDFTSRLKAVVEKEVAGVSHGFLDPMDRVTTELGLGGVRGLGDFYERRVIGYHKTVERNVEKLENKLGTLLAYKVRGNLDSSSTSRATSSVSVGAEANRTWKSPSAQSCQGVAAFNDSVCSNASRQDSMELIDLSPNLHIDSVPSLSSV